MERDEPPPMSSKESSEAKKDIFDDDEDDELFKRAIDSKLSGTDPAKTMDENDQGQEEILEEVEESSSGYGTTTSDVKHSITIEDFSSDVTLVTKISRSCDSIR